jgi:hypothetical protein
MTITQILVAVGTAKPGGCSIASVKRYLKQLKIKPTGSRIIPAVYPDDAARQILAFLGLPMNGHAGSTDDGKVVGMAKLKRIREAARRKAA